MSYSPFSRQKLPAPVERPASVRPIAKRLLCDRFGHWVRVDEVYFDEEHEALFAVWTCPVCKTHRTTRADRLQETLDRQSWVLTAVLVLPVVLLLIVFLT